MKGESGFDRLRQARFHLKRLVCKCILNDPFDILFERGQCAAQLPCWRVMFCSSKCQSTLLRLRQRAFWRNPGVLRPTLDPSVPGAAGYRNAARQYKRANFGRTRVVHRRWQVLFVLRCAGSSGQKKLLPTTANHFAGAAVYQVFMTGVGDAALCLAFQKFDLVFLVNPGVGIGRRFFLDGDDGPLQ